MKISLGNSFHCITKSALLKNFTAIASSKKPSTTFTVFSHPPLLGKDCNQFGNMANNAKGSARPKPNPPIPKLNCIAPPSFVNAPANKEPRMGPVQENETMAKVKAIKNIPMKLVTPALESAPLAKLPGSVISKYPKKEMANTTKMIKKIMLSQTLVEILLSISGSV